MNEKVIMLIEAKIQLQRWGSSSRPPANTRPWYGPNPAWRLFI